MSPYEQAKSLDLQINSILSAIDVDAAPAKERELIALLKRQIVDVRLDIRDFDYSETRAEQLRHGKQARNRLEQLQKTILTASEHGIFSAIDVAHVSAGAQHISSQLS
jgi:hypothetical protein